MSTSITADEILCWNRGGEETQRITPIVYARNPANYINEIGVEQVMDYFANYSGGCIAKSLKWT